MVDAIPWVDTFYNVVLPVVGTGIAIGLTAGAIKARDSISDAISYVFRDGVKYQSMKALEASARGSEMLMSDDENGFSASKLAIQGMIERGNQGSIRAYDRIVANERYEFAKLKYINVITKSINRR